MNLLKIIYYLYFKNFTLKYRSVSIEGSVDGKEQDIILWGVATDKGWNKIKEYYE